MEKITVRDGLEAAVARIAQQGVEVADDAVDAAEEFTIGRFAQLLRDEDQSAGLVQAILPAAGTPGRAAKLLREIDASREELPELREAVEALPGNLAEQDLAVVIEQMKPVETAAQRFFDDILVNAEDPELRAARQGLLASVLAKAPGGSTGRPSTAPSPEIVALTPGPPILTSTQEATMTTTSMFAQWAAAPTRDGLSRLQDAIQSEPLYDAYRDVTGTVVPLLEIGRYAQARAQLFDIMPTQVLSPGAHALLARCHEGLGDTDAADDERALMLLLMRVILHSGDGSGARPYEVMYTSDEYDVLEALEMRPTSQASSEVDGAFVDVFTDEAGHSVHFVLRNGGRRVAG